MKRKSILIPVEQYDMLKELASLDNRPVANYLRVLIEKEYKALQAVEDLVKFSK